MKKNTAQLLILALVFLSLLLLYKSSKLEFLELTVYDHLIKRHQTIIKTSPVTVITLTEKDFRQQKRWQISDALLANILTQLLEYNARVVGIDAYRDFPVPPGYKRLEKLFLNNQNIFVATKFDSKSGYGLKFASPPALKNKNQTGLSDLPFDRDNVVRRGLHYLLDGKSIYYSLAFHLASKYLEQEDQFYFSGWEQENFYLGNRIVKPFEPNEGGYEDESIENSQFLLDFCTPSKVIPRYPLERFQSGHIDIEDFEDKIVLIGTIAESHKDQSLTSCINTEENDHKVNGVMLHAAMTDQLLRFAKKNHTPLKTATDSQEILWIFLWTVLGGFISQKHLSLWQQTVVWVGGLGILFFITDQLFANKIWLISATPAIAWLLSSILTTTHKASQEKKDRSLMMSLFSKHVSPEIAEEIWLNRKLFSSGGHPLPQKTTATVMFTDIQHFTTISEKLDPETLFNWLNDYLESMTPLVSVHKGVVIRFIGDAIFAAFGVPVPRQSIEEISQDANHAVCCALEMEERLVLLNKKWQQQSLPPIGMRIGLYTGSLATGNIGDRDRMEYTVHGDTVNIAARLENFEKLTFKPALFSQPCRILIGEETLQHLGDQFQIKPLGNIELHGKKEAINVYQVIRKL